jgi:MFS family permease
VTAVPDPTSTRALLHQRDYMLFWASRWTGGMANLIQSVTLGWLVYEVARASMSVEEASFMLGMVGLVSFLPVLALVLVAGESADRNDRRTVLLWCLGAEVATVATLLALAWTGAATVPLLLVMAALFGCARAFFAPANTALGPMLVPRELLPRAIAWNSLAWQSSAIVGPAVGGLLVAESPVLAFAVALALYATAALCIFLIRGDTRPVVQPGSRWTLMKEGLNYVWTNKIVFGAISLDLAAVLLAGATAMLPVFARDILHVGPEGFGLLRAAPAVGATSVALYLAANPIRARAGRIMFAGVAVFALATVVFGWSRILWLSVAMLALLGGADMLSVYVRQTLIQLVTPDPMRGRVAAVSTLFIGASNELGEFRAGVAARFMGPVMAVLAGGFGALSVTALWIRLFPALWRADRLE